MKIVVVGEGEWDVGGTCEGEDYQGDIPLIIRQILKEYGCHKRFSIIPWALNDKELFGRLQPKPGADIRARKLERAIGKALSEPARDAFVFVIDGRTTEMNHLRRALKTVITDYENRTQMKIVIGLAIQEIEAWLLADPQTLAAAFGTWAQNRVDGRPEDLDDPKQEWLHLLGMALERSRQDDGIEVNHVERRTLGIEAMRPYHVSLRCPNGFKPFREDIRKELIPLFGKSGKTGSQKS